MVAFLGRLSYVLAKKAGTQQGGADMQFAGFLDVSISGVQTMIGSVLPPR